MIFAHIGYQNINHFADCQDSIIVILIFNDLNSHFTKENLLIILLDDLIKTFRQRALPKRWTLKG